MRVAFDEQIFLLQRHGGVSRYYVELVRALESAGVECELPFQTVTNEHALAVWPPGPQRWPARTMHPARGPLQPYPQLLAAGLRPRRTGAADLAHHTFYHPRFLRDYPGVPKVITIYDMIPEIVGERGRFGNPHMAKREFVKRASLILYISQSAREDLESVYGAPDAAVAITHLGVDEQFHAGGPLPPGFPTDYLLFVGRRTSYKDFPTMARTYAALESHRRAGLWLACVGGGPFTTAEQQMLGELGIAATTLQFSLPDSEMPGAYANAAAFVFPSTYEGFGLPAVEAMAAGTPTVLADTSSLPEVGGPAARYFPPGDPEAAAAVIGEILDSTDLAEQLRVAGRARAREFSWQRTAQATAAAYEHALAG